MKRFPLRDMPVRTKLTLLTTFLCTLAVGLACVAFIAWDTDTFKRRLVNEVQALADVVGSNSAAAILFEDPATAQATLRGLGNTEHVRCAALLRADGSVFAHYDRPGEPHDQVPSLQPGEHRLVHGVLMVRREIRDRGERWAPSS